MYAIIRTGGKQYTVRAGDTLRVEKLPRELGAEFDVDEVLLVGGEQIHVGEPTVKNAKVTMVVTQQAKAPKVIVFKKRRRQGYRRLHGHRQLYTELFVKAIRGPTGEVSEAERNAVVVDPAKKLERQAQHADKKTTETSAAPKAKKAAGAKKAKTAVKKATKPGTKAKAKAGTKKATTKKSTKQ